MKNTFISFLFLATLSLLLSSCTKENNGIELKEVEDVCTQMDDINFRNFCYTNFDVNKDGKVSMTEANAVREIIFENQNIKSLVGIEYFTNLTMLNCDYNNLTSLDVSKCINLTVLWCDCNNLTSLDVSKCINLTELDCGRNDLTSLDVSKCINLSTLRCYSNNLTSLDVSKCINLTQLVCYYNNLTSLDVSKCINLTELRCHNNNLTSLDVSKCINLTVINCTDNPLTIIYMNAKHKNISLYYPEGVYIKYLDS